MSRAVCRPIARNWVASASYFSPFCDASRPRPSNILNRYVTLLDLARGAPGGCVSGSATRATARLKGREQLQECHQYCRVRRQRHCSVACLASLEPSHALRAHARRVELLLNLRAPSKLLLKLLYALPFNSSVMAAFVIRTSFSPHGKRRLIYYSLR